MLNNVRMALNGQSKFSTKVPVDRLQWQYECSCLTQKKLSNSKITKKLTTFGVHVQSNSTGSSA